MNSALSLETTTLLIVDVQKAHDELEATGVGRNNPDAELRIADLLARFRALHGNIIHVRHDSTEPQSGFCKGLPGFEVMAQAKEQDGEPVIVKSVHSSFIGTDLETRLRAAGIENLVIAGAVTNHCVETTARMAGNLGFNAKLVRDATWTFDQTGPDGDKHSAAEVHAMSLMNLNAEFAEIVTTQNIIERLGAEQTV